MPRRAKEEAEKTKQRILTNALALFVKKGYEKTTFTDIAARLKMTKGAVYWHFESKETLLKALVDEMLAKFERQMTENLPKEGLTYPAVARTMIEMARQTIGETRNREFFLLMKTQIRWGEASMARVREDLLKNSQVCPFNSFRLAVETDKAAGRVRKEVDAEEVAAVSLAVWEGLVQAKIDGFLQKDAEKTLTHAYEAMWKAIGVV